MRDDHLTLRRNDGEPMMLEAVDGGYYIPAGELDIAFVDRLDGETDFLIIDEQPFRRLPEPPPAEQPGAEELARYVGTYATISAFEGPHYPITFIVEDGRLSVCSGGEQSPCIALGGGCFISAVGLAEFEEGGVRCYGCLLKLRVQDRAQL